MDSKILRSFPDLDVVTRRSHHMLTLFSGGLDSTYLLKELASRRVRVTALAVDVGEGVNRADLQEIAARFGAELEVVDAREAFAQEAVLPAIRAQAKYLGIYPISSSLSRPVLAQAAVCIARERGCDAILHTANQSQNSLRRLNGAIAQLGFTGWYGTPYEFSALSREEKIRQLHKAGLPGFQARGVSGDANLWCREFESGALDNPEAFWVPESLFEWTAVRDLCPAHAEIAITFERGVPVALDGEALPLQALIAQANERVGAFGIGRYSGLEHLEHGEKVLEVREAPAAAILMEAYRHLETATLGYELLREKMTQEQVWVREAVEGRWFTGLRLAADTFIASTAQAVTGTVRFGLRRGAADLCSIRAAKPLYLTDRDAWEQVVCRARGTMGLVDDAAGTVREAA